VPLHDRILGCCSYIVPAVEAVRVINRNFPSTSKTARRLLGSLLDVPTNGWGGFIVFMGLNYIVQHPGKLSRTIRFSVSQAMALRTVVWTTGLLNRVSDAFLWKLAASASSTIILLAALYSIGVTLTGDLPDNLPFISEKCLLQSLK